MKEKTCCFTGHREIPLKDRNAIRRALEAEVIRLIEDGYCYFGAGGALGFDTMAEQTVLNLKPTYPQIKLILVLPCETQAKSWSREDQLLYEQIKQQADKIVYVSKDYFRGCMQKRNRYLVDNSSSCICYLTKPTGGTAYTVSYAQKHKLRVSNVQDQIATDTGAQNSNFEYWLDSLL